MIYEPEHLKDRKAMYEKREKWLVRFVFSAWALLLFIYVNIAISHVKSTLGFLGIIIGDMVIITVIYFFTMFLILMRRQKLQSKGKLKNESIQQNAGSGYRWLRRNGQPAREDAGECFGRVSAGRYI